LGGGRWGEREREGAGERERERMKERKRGSIICNVWNLCDFSFKKVFREKM
jgi:hypothetical protein